jgi:thiamine biosynthesis lipoprotein
MVNKGLINHDEYSADMQEVFALSEETKKITNGNFNIKTPEGIYDPSGLVKGWAIYNASNMLLEKGYKNFYIDIGGDIQACGKNALGEKWSIGIRSPFNPENEIIKVVLVEDRGVATSGVYARGAHIYNPHTSTRDVGDVASITVIGPNIYEADRFATAAFVLGKEGINFLEALDGFEGYAIDSNGIATMTSNFDQYV